MPKRPTPLHRRVRELRLRHQLRRQLAEVGITGPMNMTEVCHRLAQRRGKPIKLLAYPLWVPGSKGVWLSTPAADYVLYQQQTTQAHQEHIIAHELGHLTLEHPSDEDDDTVWSELLPNIDPAKIRRALRRTSYDTQTEQDAETAATLLLQTASVTAAVTRPSRSDRAQRTQEALSDPQGWV